jgi:CHAT domain-containing protein/Tfp pilus assembly protein PilF
VATCFNNLGLVASERGEIARAEEYQKRALDIEQKLAPDTLQEATTLNNLGVLAWKRGDLSRSAEWHRSALAIRQKLAPQSAHVVSSLTNLGSIAFHSGEVSRAEEYYEQALKIQEKLSPESLNAAKAVSNLGNVALNRGDMSRAEQYYKQALAIYKKLAPGSFGEAAVAFSAGKLLRSEGQVRSATGYFEQAVDALEHQTTNLGGTEDIRSTFRAEHVDIYFEFENALIAAQRGAEAYHVSERYRARSFLETLAQRDLLFSKDVPAELQRARKQNAAEYDRVQSQMQSLSPERDQKKIDELLGRLRDVNNDREQIIEQIKKASPRFAALQYPQPLDLEQTRHDLDEGTTLLSYAVGPEHTLLFVVQAARIEPGFSVFTLPIKEKELRSKVQTFRKLIEDRRPGDDPELVAQSRQLYDLFIKPAESILQDSDRLLIVPDGALQMLPFAALQREDKQYLVEWKPLHTAMSATVYAEIKKTRPLHEDKPLELVAFGDPQVPSTRPGSEVLTGNIEARFASERGFGFAPLPFSRKEVEGIAKLFPERSRMYLGAEATEERAKAVGTGVRYIHFATHGLLDERLPLNSAVVLTIPEKVAEGQENGLLQGWEIFDQVRLDADLVTLSACNTGLGQELSGEGLIGLTRAFQYAGARSVLASLWNVDDFRTMQLMMSFYSQLKNGKTKDEALRQAQIEFLHNRSSYSPYYWAAFSLSGDWK